MKLIRNINKLIIKKVIEIIFVIVFLFVSVSLWKSENAKNFLVAINTFNNLNYTSIDVVKPINLQLLPIIDSEALDMVEPYIISVINGTYTNESFTLVLRISKNSFLDYKYLKISIDDNIYNLVDFEFQEDSEDYLFILDKDSIKGEEKVYKVRLWLNDEIGNVQGKNLLISFDLINQTTKM